LPSRFVPSRLSPARLSPSRLAPSRPSPSESPAEVESSQNAEAEETIARLRDANFRLESALAFKNDLTSMLTHDVAQPISSIASLAELLRADWHDLPDDLRFELATKIDKNTQRLIKMMNDLQLLFRLDMSSVRARQSPVPLREVVAAVTAGLPAGGSASSGDDGISRESDTSAGGGHPGGSGDGGPAGIVIEIDDELVVLADRAHLTAIVQHLVTNALAYGATPVLVRAHATHGAEQVEMVVQDSGPGIPEDLVPNLFGRFVRGKGLGLFIVRHLVEANGGSVRYEPAGARGARLIVTLDAAPV
jgi:signal transduction histidine kinase